MTTIQAQNLDRIAQTRDTYNQIGKATLIIFSMTLADKLLAMFKEMLVARRFGISAEMDVYNIAYLFPTIILLLVGGAMSTSFVRLYHDWSNTSSPRETNADALGLCYATGAFFALLTIVCYLFAPSIFNVLGSRFSPEGKLLGGRISRILMLLLIIDGVAIFFRALLFARKKFWNLYLAPTFINITIIAFLLHDNVAIDALVWGTLVGTAINVGSLVISLKMTRSIVFIAQPRFDKVRLHSFVMLMFPLLCSNFLAYSNMFVDQVAATFLPPGSVSTLRYAGRINDLPTQILVVAIIRAMLPFISEHAAKGNILELGQIYKRSIVFLFTLTIPITCLMFLFSEDIVTLVFQRGAFDIHAAKQTAQVLSCYTLGLFFFAYTCLNGDFFITIKRTKSLFHVGWISISLNFALDILFMHLFGVKGIALSSTVTLAVITVIFVVMLRRHLQIADFSEVYSSFSRVILAALGMYCAGFVLLKCCQSVGLDRLFYFPSITLIISAGYLAAIWRFGTQELQACLKMVLSMVPWLSRYGLS